MMALSIEHAIHERLQLCGNRCENTFEAKFREGAKRCENKQGEYGITYKGRVLLTPFYQHKNETNTNNIRMWCYKCHKEYAIRKQAKKPKPRPIKKDKDQIDLFN